MGMKSVGKETPTVYQSKQVPQSYSEGSTNNTLRAAVSKLLFPNISTTIVSQKIFRGLDELLPSLIFWVGENLLFFFFLLFCTALFQFPRQRPDDADDSEAAVASPDSQPRCQRLGAAEKSQSKSFGFNELPFPAHVDSNGVGKT